MALIGGKRRKAEKAAKAEGNPANRLKVFISYSRRDLEIADALVMSLEVSGFSVKIDRRDLPYGEEWQKELSDFMREADIIVWLVSPDSLKSRWCNWELGVVQRFNKRLIPILVREIDYGTLPATLGKIHMLPAEGTYLIDRHLAALITTLNTDRTWVKESTRLGEKAREWLARSRDKNFLLRGSALKSAERWVGRQPMTAPAPASEVLELIIASRRAAARTYRRWVIGSFAVLTVIVQVGLLSIFFRNDAIMNETRYALQDTRVDAAQNRLAVLTANPLTWVMPDSASSRALATQFLDTALIEKLMPLELKNEQLAYNNQSTILYASDKLFGALWFGDSKIIFRCERGGSGCRALKLGREWGSIILLRDGDSVYAAGKDPELEDRYIISRIPIEGTLSVTPETFEQAQLKQLRKIDGNWFWIGQGFAAAMVGRSDFLSESPPVGLDAGLKSLPIPMFSKPKVAQAASDAAAANDVNPSLSKSGRCSTTLKMCVLPIVDFEEDARGTITQFDLWSAQPEKIEIKPARAGNVDQPDPQAEPKWRLVAENFYQPLPSLNELALTEDGNWLAISTNETIRLWDVRNAQSKHAQPYRTIRVSGVVLAMVFERGTNNLLYLTKSGLERLRVYPRAEWRELPAAATTFDLSPYPEADGFVAGTINGTLDIVKRPEGVFIFDRTSRALSRLTGQLASNQDIMVWHDAGAVTLFDEERKVSRLIFPASSDMSADTEIPGRVVFAADSGRLAGYLQDNCQLRVGVSGEWFADIQLRIMPVSACADAQTVQVSLAGTSEDFLATFSAGQSSEDTTAKISDMISIVHRGDGPPIVVRVGDDDTPKRAGAVVDDTGLYFVSGRTFVKIALVNGFRTERLQITDNTVIEQTNSSDASDHLRLRRLGQGLYAAFTNAADCNLKTSSGEDEQAANITLLQERGSTLATSFQLKCVPQFPPDPSAHNSKFASVSDPASGRYWFGAYPFGAIFEWQPDAGALALYLLGNAEQDKPQNFADAEPRAFGATSGGAPIYDYSLVKLASQWLGSTVMKFAAERILFYRHGEGTPGHSTVVDLIDLPSRTTSVTASITRDYFDRIETADFSPGGALILTRKESPTVLYELFRAQDLRTIPMPPDAVDAKFLDDTRLEIKLANGASVIWHVPESAGGETTYLRQQITAGNNSATN